MSITPRMRRLFASDGKCFDVVIDHGIFGETRFLGGIENIQGIIETIVAANPDAIQLSPGQAHWLQNIPGKQKPALVLRTDIANIYGPVLPKYLYSQVIENAVEQAVILDAAGIVVNLFLLPDQPEFYHQCLTNICRLKPLCEHLGMPLMIETLALQHNDKVGGGYVVDSDLHKILGLVRQAVEIGADVIKADPCDDPTEYQKVIEIASGVPVLVRGGDRVPDEEIVDRTYTLMQQGAAGIVYGRNVLQHAQPGQMTRALMALVHHQANPAQAMTILSGGQR